MYILLFKLVNLLNKLIFIVYYEDKFCLFNLVYFINNYVLSIFLLVFKF